ncbi:transcriptional regulator [Chryseobacterium sp. PMSZPI]|uniref:transcriptional regulator n=1 Tax=Chryseobacterium sp. PMSZPI TaxID=1033900 RepID=UPI00399F0889
MFPNIKIIYLIAISLSIFLKAQDYSYQPEPIKTTLEYRYKLDAEGALRYNINALKQYEKTDNTEGIIMAYTNIGSILCGLDKNKEGLEFLNKAKKMLTHINDPLVKASLYNEYGRSYTRLGLYEQSDAAFDEAKFFIKKINNLKQREFFESYNYSWKQMNPSQTKNSDSLQIIKKKIMGVKPNIVSYTRIADKFIAKKIHLDSAEYYMNKAFMYSKDASDTEKGIALFSYGDLYNVKGNKEKALEYYFKSLDIFQKGKDRRSLLTVYDTISSVYKSLNEIDKSSQYLRAYTALNDSIIKNQKEGLNLAVDTLMELNKKEKDHERNVFYLIILALITSSVLLLYFIRKIYIKKTLKKAELLKEIKTETEVLKLKVNDSFDEIIQLMKSRSPLFLKRFKEVYCEFYEKLITHTPELTEHDIKFCAYMKLNLTNKEICNCENISLRGVETKRYRLKKKLNLSKNTELQKWILEL